MNDKALVISQVCASITRGALDEAVAALSKDYPFAPSAVTKRAYGLVESTRVFIRDGFIDRYSGQRLIFPPVLRILSARIPEAFPFHPNWKTDVTHSSYWEVGATVDHLVPVTRGGSDAEFNLMTTSMARNSAKMNWTIEELGWSIHPAGDMNEWDGLFGWFMEYTAEHSDVHSAGSVKRWRKAASIAVGTVR
jgi:hypothetical protein